MSVKAMNYVRALPVDLAPARVRAVLYVLAWRHQFGKVLALSIPVLAKESGTSESQCRRNVTEVVERGIIGINHDRAKGGRGVVHEFHFPALEKPAVGARVFESNERQKLSHIRKENPSIARHEVSPIPLKGTKTGATPDCIDSGEESSGQPNAAHVRSLPTPDQKKHRGSDCVAGTVKKRTHTKPRRQPPGVRLLRDLDEMLDNPDPRPAEIAAHAAHSLQESEPDFFLGDEPAPAAPLDRLFGESVNVWSDNVRRTDHKAARKQWDRLTRSGAITVEDIPALRSTIEAHVDYWSANPVQAPSFASWLRDWRWDDELDGDQ